MFITLGRLSKINQWSNDLIDLLQFLLCHAYSGTGSNKKFMVLSVCELSIVLIFVCDRAAADLLITAIADIRRPIKAVTAFFHEILTGLIACRTGCAFDSA